MFLQRPITMWTATAKVLKGREREKIKVVQRYVTMRRWRMTRKGKGNKRSHRQEIRRARLSNTFSFFFFLYYATNTAHFIYDFVLSFLIHLLS